MVDARTQELISGYLDDALSLEERATVERQLTESSECRQFLDQLRRQQDLLRAVPRRKVSVDLSQRVRAEVERRRPQVASAASTNVSAATVAESAAGRGSVAGSTGWRRVVWAVGGVAAVLVAMLYVQSRSGPEPVAIQPSPAVPAPKPRELPEITLAAIQDFRSAVKMCLVYDVTVTPDGQRDKIVEQWLLAAGIPMGSPVAIDEKLEQKIRDSSLVKAQRVPAKDGPAKDGQAPRDRVQLMLIRGTAKHIDAFFLQYNAIRNQAVRPAEIKLNMVFADRELQLFMQLNMVQGMALDDLRANRDLLKQPMAVPFEFPNPLQSVSVTPGKPAVTRVARRVERAVAQAVPPAAPAVRAENELGVGWDEPSQALLIIRNQLP